MWSVGGSKWGGTQGRLAKTLWTGSSTSTSADRHWQTQGRGPQRAAKAFAAAASSDGASAVSSGGGRCASAKARSVVQRSSGFFSQASGASLPSAGGRRPS